MTRTLNAFPSLNGLLFRDSVFWGLRGLRSRRNLRIRSCFYVKRTEIDCSSFAPELFNRNLRGANIELLEGHYVEVRAIGIG